VTPCSKYLTRSCVISGERCLAPPGSNQVAYQAFVIVPILCDAEAYRSKPAGGLKHGALNGKTREGPAELGSSPVPPGSLLAGNYVPSYGFGGPGGPGGGGGAAAVMLMVTIAVVEAPV
jgi:hypothetical protein